MREFEYTAIDNEVLKRGIRPYEQDIINFPLLEELYDVKCGSDRLIPYEPLEVFGTVGGLENWPFPKYLHGTSEAFLAHIDEGDLVISKIVDVGSLVSEAVKDSVLINMESLPDVADFDAFMVVMGSFGILYGEVGDYYNYSETALDDTPLGLTCCNFKGQLIIGNIISNWYGCGSSHVVWSEIGSINCTPSADNIAGYMDVSEVGEVYKVMRIGDQILVYGSTGIVSLLPLQEPEPTFGMQEIASFGLANREAIAGDFSQHLFLGANGIFYIVGVDKEVHRLEYKSIAETLSIPDTKIEYDPIKQEFFISDGERCFLYTAFGMCEVYQLTAAVIPIDGVAYGIFDELNPWFSLTTDRIDFFQRGMKTLMLVESDVDGCIVDVEIRSGGSEWELYKSVVANEFNTATIMVTAQEFKVTLRKYSFDGVYPSYIKIRYKATDLRNIRGQYE